MLASYLTPQFIGHAESQHNHNTPQEAGAKNVTGVKRCLCVDSSVDRFEFCAKVRVRVR